MISVLVVFYLVYNGSCKEVVVIFFLVMVRKSLEKKWNLSWVFKNGFMFFSRRIESDYFRKINEYIWVEW